MRAASFLVLTGWSDPAEVGRRAPFDHDALFPRHHDVARCARA
jgi:hypothetical protein